MGPASRAQVLLLVLLCLDGHIGTIGGLTTPTTAPDDRSGIASDVFAGFIGRPGTDDKIKDEHFELTTANFTHEEVMKESMLHVTMFFILYLLREISVAKTATQIQTCRMDRPLAGFERREYQYNGLEKNHGVWPTMTAGTRVVVLIDPTTNETRLFPYSEVTNLDKEHSILGVMFHTGDFHTTEENAVEDGDVVISTGCKPFTMNHPQFKTIFGTSNGLGDTFSSMDDAQITVDVLKPGNGMHWCPQVYNGQVAKDKVQERSGIKAYLRLEPKMKGSSYCYIDGEYKGSSETSESIELQKKLDSLVTFRGLQAVLFELKTEVLGMGSNAFRKEGARGNLMGLRESKSKKPMIYFAFVVLSYGLCTLGPSFFVMLDLAGKTSVLTGFKSGPMSDGVLMFRVLYLRVVVLILVPLLFYVFIYFEKRHVEGQGNNWDIGGGYFGTFYIICIVGAANIVHMMLYYDAQRLEKWGHFHRLNVIIAAAQWINHVLGLLFFANAVGMGLQEYFGTTAVLPPIMTDTGEHMTLGLMGLIDSGIGFIQSVQDNYGMDTMYCDLRVLHHMVTESPSVLRHPGAVLDYTCTAPTACNESDTRMIPCPWTELPLQQARVNLQEGFCTVSCTVGSKTSKPSPVACAADGLRISMWTWEDINGETVCEQAPLELSAR